VTQVGANTLPSKVDLADGRVLPDHSSKQYVVPARIDAGSLGKVQHTKGFFGVAIEPLVSSVEPFQDPSPVTETSVYKDLVLEVFADAFMICREDQHENEPLMCAVMAGPDGPVLTDWQTKALHAWKSVAEQFGVKDNAPTTPCRILMFPARQASETIPAFTAGMESARINDKNLPVHTCGLTGTTARY